MQLESKLNLKEFVQGGFTCENGSGWSRIDRAYTNLHVADICIHLCACNLLQHPRHLSDHFPVSLSIRAARRRSRSKCIPRWVTQHKDHMTELVEEFMVRCADFEKDKCRQPGPSEQLSILKKSAHATTSYIRRLCKDVEARTVEHKLAICMSFIWAIYGHNFEEAKKLQCKCAELMQVSIGHGTWCSEDFAAVKEKTVVLMHADIKERTEELRMTRNSLPEHLYEQRKHGIAELLKRMLPGGSAEVSVMMNDNGDIITDTKEIAACLNKHWQRVLDEKVTNPGKSMEWLEEVRNKFKVAKTQLRPTRKLVRQVINEAPSPACGPDSIPFEVYKAAGEVAVTLFLNVACAMLDGQAVPDDDF